jgi:hypothetical protein
MRSSDLPGTSPCSFRRGRGRCASTPICCTIEQTKSLREEPDGGGKPLEEALTRRRHLPSRRLRKSQRLCGLLLLRIESTERD